MNRYTRIEAVTFGQTSIPLPIAARVSRQTIPQPAQGDADRFATSIEISDPVLTAEIRVRGTATAEEFSLGQQEDLLITVAPTTGTGSSRNITLSAAILISVELTYEQSAIATAVLRFVAEASDGQQEPFSVEDAE